MSKECPQNKYKILANFALLVIAAIWGSTFLMVDRAVETISSLVFIALRFSIAFIALIIVFGYQLIKLEKVAIRDIIAGILIGIFLFIGYTFQTFGLQLGTSASKAAFITGLSVVLVPIFASLLLRKVPHPLSWIGVFLSVVGLGLLTIDLPLFIKIGDLLVLACAFGFAFHIITIDKFVVKTHFSILAVVQTGTTAILAWIAALIFWDSSFPVSFNTQSLFAIAFTGTIATALILAVQTFIQKMTTPTNVAIIFAMEPVFGALFAIIFGNEYLRPIQWIGCGLILISMVGQQIIDLRFQKVGSKTQTDPEDIVKINSHSLEKKKRGR